MSCKPKTCAGALSQAITIVRRVLGQPEPGAAEPVISYEAVFAARAEIKTRAGVSEWNRVEIKGTAVTHVMTVRYTTLAFDIRDRVRDSQGNLYAILQIEDVDEERRWLKLYCARQGHESQKAVA